MMVLQKNLGIAEEGLIKAIQEGRETERDLCNVATAKNVIIDILTEKAIVKATLHRENIYELSEQVGHQLAVRTGEQSTVNLIREIKDPDYGQRTEPNAIRSAFQRFYQKLYDDLDIQQEKMEEYVVQNAPLRLEVEDQDRLDGIPQWEEILLSMNSLATGKAAGMDGILTEFYVKFSPQLK